MTASKIENEVNDLSETELLAVFQGLQLCAHLDIPELIVESDSLLSVKAIREGGDSLTVMSNLLWKLLTYAKIQDIQSAIYWQAWQ